MAVAIHVVRIDGQKYYLLPDDLDDTTLPLLIFALEHNNGSLDLNRGAIPEEIRAQESGEELWKNYLDQIEKKLKEIIPYTYVAPADQYSLDAVVKKVAASKYKTLSKAGSTRKVDNEKELFDGRDSTPLRYALAYGVQEEAIPKITPLRTTTLECDLLDEKIPRPGRHIKKEVGDKGSERIGMVEQRRVVIEGDVAEAIEYCHQTQVVSWNKFSAAMAFIWQHRPEIALALDILSANHPERDPGNIELFFYRLINTEFNLFNRIDLEQDLAAGKFAKAAQLEALAEQADPFDRIFSGCAGSLAWEIKSSTADIPIETQGLGPLQIIPGLAIAAFQEPGLFKSYERILSPDDFQDVKSVIRAILDPKKMFAVKAMTWDLQLRQAERVEGLMATTSSPPHLHHVSTAKELAILHGAEILVQYPDFSFQEFYVEVLSSAYDNVLVDLFLIGNLQGVIPHFDGIRTEVSDKICTAASFGYYQVNLNTPYVCLYSE